jgi:hypothetical protein
MEKRRVKVLRHSELLREKTPGWPESLRGSLSGWIEAPALELESVWPVLGSVPDWIEAPALELESVWPVLGSLSGWIEAPALESELVWPVPGSLLGWIEAPALQSDSAWSAATGSPWGEVSENLRTARWSVQPVVAHIRLQVGLPKPRERRDTYSCQFIPTHENGGYSR